jgi:small subunit ribosomal protein S27e
MSEMDFIPIPKSIFLRVKCRNCGNEQIIFNRACTTINCTVCNEILSEPTGGKIDLKGDIIQEFR